MTKASTYRPGDPRVHKPPENEWHKQMRELFGPNWRPGFLDHDFEPPPAYTPCRVPKGNGR